MFFLLHLVFCLIEKSKILKFPVIVPRRPHFMTCGLCLLFVSNHRQNLCLCDHKNKILPSAAEREYSQGMSATMV